MKALQRVVVARQASTIRALQRVSAEVAAAKAAKELREIRQEKEACVNSCERREQQWFEAISRPSLAVDVASQWAEALKIDEHRLFEAIRNEDEALARLDQARHRWNLAVVREKYSQEALKAAYHMLRRKKDSAQYDVVEDLYAIRRGL